MRKALEIFLGVMTALGGFVDIGELVFMAQAGARFSYSLLWVVAVGTVGIIVYSEMCGRIAAIAKQPVFVVIRQRMGPTLGMITFIASTIVNVVTCAAEIGGIALILKLLVGGGPQWMPLVVAAALIALIALLPFRWIERVFGVAGLTMIVFFVAMLAIHPDWGGIARGLVPNAPPIHGHDIVLYGYFIVGILSSVMMPYEVYFYSSGGIEDGWTKDDLGPNKINTIFGFSLGSLVSMALLVLGAELLMPRGIIPDTLGSTAMMVGIPFGKIGITLALVGMLTAVAGAATETALAGAYNYAQFFDHSWGRSLPIKATKKFDAAWMIMFVLGALIMVTGIDPVEVVELSVMAAVVCLPLTYLPILLTARDPAIMGERKNGPIANALGWVFFVIITATAVAAPILLVATKMGKY
ncbi:MAG: divalent metal cation transporter [Deltaproteobacteria bacterium]|nr:divalent metal cation transporter [Deltaproteobacteria bacterium]